MDVKADLPPSGSGCSAASLRGSRPSLWGVLRGPLPCQRDWRARWVCRTLLTVFRGQLAGVTGQEIIAGVADPFILALNHNQRPEAILAPTWVSWLRRGRTVHFLADWNFLLLPVVGAIIRLHDPIIVANKSARPKFLNRLKPWFSGARPPFEEARLRIQSGRSVGVFPEGTVNRHRTVLLRGRPGAALLALQTGAPVVPCGIVFPGRAGSGPIRDSEPFALRFGAPIHAPCEPKENPGSEAVAGHHRQIMTAISTLSGKRWQAESRRSKYAFDQE